MRLACTLVACAAAGVVLLVAPQADSSTPAAVALGTIAIAVVAVAAAVLAVAWKPEKP